MGIRKKELNMRSHLTTADFDQAPAIPAVALVRGDRFPAREPFPDAKPIGRSLRSFPGSGSRHEIVEVDPERGRDALLNLDGTGFLAILDVAKVRMGNARGGRKFHGYHAAIFAENLDGVHAVGARPDSSQGPCFLNCRDSRHDRAGIKTCNQVFIILFAQEDVVLARYRQFLDLTRLALLFINTVTWTGIDDREDPTRIADDDSVLTGPNAIQLADLQFLCANAFAAGIGLDLFDDLRPACWLHMLHLKI